MNQKNSGQDISPLDVYVLTDTNQSVTTKIMSFAERQKSQLRMDTTEETLEKLRELFKIQSPT